MTVERASKKTANGRGKWGAGGGQYVRKWNFGSGGMLAKNLETEQSAERGGKGREKREEPGRWLGPWMEWIQLSLRVSWLLGVWPSARESLERDGYLFLPLGDFLGPARTYTRRQRSRRAVQRISTC